ncbi:class I SAM-dependent methyltransferase [Sediminibacterium ginsengisoli]|uniref:Methyltransferase domain-containing protein n=1 Tax=Sediminibacterium ginsengisoli TaxID=413434 RepID=A0A1T4Q5F9_9BACT|nr:class I SAM-dependent methyltransferase [Sediminibacterium ginsengisoli]SJZ98894.1 Methyltransferase domain-containing protein [Sediminibacterium ginsengisoli]
MSTRKINWVSSLNQVHENAIAALEHKMQQYYARNNNYYETIDFTSSNWADVNETGYNEIQNLAAEAGSICEIGCGSANILYHHPEIENRYHGCDFSPQLIQKNKERYPEAQFNVIRDPAVLPFEDNCFDLVFSVFVIEHSARPASFLDECKRILKPGGRLIILCPDFMGYGRMSSQRAGFSQGTTSQKIAQRRFIDAAITFFDNRMRIPFKCSRLIRQAEKEPLFMVNLAPTVFTDVFLPDVDAVYITNRNEMVAYLQHACTLQENSPALKKYEKERELIFINAIKRRHED